MACEITLMEAVKATHLEPDVRIEGIRRSGAVLYEYVGGSTCYGTNLPSSDKDIRGVFCLPKSQYLTITKPVDLVSDEREIEGKKKNDSVFYTLLRTFELLKKANPNILEALWVPNDCIVTTSPEMEVIIQNRNLFISKSCLGSHYGYAQSQIDRAQGKNKKVNNPQPKERPKKLDFCRVISCIPGAKPWTHPDVELSRFPFRPILLKEIPWVNLAHYHVAAVEHMQNAYRMYYYGEDAKGVFRGDDMLVCDSIPMDDEHPRFSGILLYDEAEYQRAVKEWKSYWDWVSNRNISRWIDQEGGKLSFDAKNMTHCMRLLMSGINIVKNGEPIVRFSGDQLKYLMKIRTGEITKYDEIMADVQAKIAEMEEGAKISTIPEKVDSSKIDALYSEVSEMAWKRLFKNGMDVLA
jgi:hypothetical protein